MDNDPASPRAPSSASSSASSSIASTVIGRCAVALSFVSLLAYYATSLGIHNFVAFGIASVRKVLQASGHGG